MRDALQTRRKVRKACIPCQSRKRKCDGHEPCSLCVRYEYDCKYAQPNAQPKSSPPTPSSTIPNGLAASAPPAPRVSLSDTTSGVAFALCVGTKNAVQKTSHLTLGWNIGERDKPALSTQLMPATSLTSLISFHQLQHEIDQYFSTIGSLFPIISPNLASSLLGARYNSSSPTEPQPLLDSVLAGLGALGIAFSRGLNQDSRQLADMANRYISHCNERDPVLLNVAASALRTFWLRTVSAARPCWLESCNLVHLLEATGLNATSASNEDAKDLYWTSRLINMWVSFELGKPHVELPGTDDTVLPQATRRNASNVLGLYTSTRMLSPIRSSDLNALEGAFAHVEGFDCKENDSLALSRTVLAMSIFRKIYVQFPGPSTQFKTRVITVGMQGIQSVERLLLAKGPWWHQLNLPLQLLCLLIVLESYSEISIVLDTLRRVQQVHNTESVNATLSFAESIVGAVQEKLDTQSRALRQSLSKQPLLPTGAEDVANWTTSAPAEALAAPIVTMDQLAWDLFPNSATAAFDFTALDQLSEPNLYPTS